MRDISEFDVPILAGLHSAGPDHWQSHWEAAFPNMRRVELGTSLVMRWAHTAKTHSVAGAFLVAPTDLENDPDSPARGFAPMLLRPLPFPSMVLASRNDEFVSFERAQAFATAWGSCLVDVGPQGHIGSAAKLGLWPQGLVWLGQFIASLPPHAKCRSEPSLDEAPADG